MRYFRAMSRKELEKLLSGETLTREGRKNWFLETSNFYFLSSEKYNWEKMKNIMMFFFDFIPENIVVEFETKDELETVYQKDYDVNESICKEYSLQTMKPIRFRSVFGFLEFGNWETIENYHTIAKQEPKINKTWKRKRSQERKEKEERKAFERMSFSF